MSTAGPADALVVLGRSPVAEAIARQAAVSGQAAEARQAAGAGPVIRAATVADVPASGVRLVVVDLEDDVASIEALAVLTARPAGSVPPILVDIRDPVLQRALDDSLRARAIVPRPAIVSTASLSVAAAIAELRPYDLAYWRGQARVHAVVIGFSVLGRACFDELILSGVAGELDRPRITILDPDPGAVGQLIARDMPEIGVSAEITVAALDPLRLTAPDGPLAAAAAADPITLVVIATDEPRLTIAIMGALARAQDGDSLAVASVLVLSEARAPLLGLLRPVFRERDFGRQWSVRGGIEGDPDVLDLLLNRADALATRIHNVYQARFGGSGPASGDWAGLPETYRRANRRAAGHLAAKLWTIGLRDRHAGASPFAVEPHAYANVIRPCAESTAEDALLRRLSRMEHDRWCAERRLDGWRFGEVRDDGRRIHPKLIPFDDPRFTDEDIEKDADQVRFLFGTVVESVPEGAVTPLVLGILSAPRDLPGIGIEAALRLCRGESWRPVVVVSGLLDMVECRLLAELDAALTLAGQSWRLLVPEISRGNREIRLVSGPADTARLQGFLDRPSTRFAPIGSPAEPVDLWADPSAPDPHADAIAAYVAARASAVLDGTAGT